MNIEELNNSDKLGKVFIIDKKDKPDCISWKELAELLYKIKIIEQ